MKVTCGGRVIATDYPAMYNPRQSFANNGNQKFQGAKPFFPSSMNAGNNPHDLSPVFPPIQAPTGFLAYDYLGRICQVVNGQVMPVQTVDNPFFRGLPPTPISANFSSGLAGGTALGQSILPLPLMSPTSSMAGHNIPQPPNVLPFLQIAQDNSLDLASRINALETEHASVEQKLKELERTEVVQGDLMGQVWRAEVIQSKRGFIIFLDQVRKLIKGLKEKPYNGAAVAKLTAPPSLQQPKTTPHETQSQIRVPGAIQLTNDVIGDISTTQQSAVESLNYVESHGMISPTELELPAASQSYQQALLGSFLTPTTGLDAGSDDTKGRSRSVYRQHAGPKRSHAVEIKDPRETKSKSVIKRSTLNPTSPTYQPSHKFGPEGTSPTVFVPTSPSTIASPKFNEALQSQNPWLFEQRKLSTNIPDSPPSVQLYPRRKASVSSISTADFFPVNTHEYSSNRYSDAAMPEEHEEKGTRAATSFTSFRTATNLSNTPMNDENSNPATMPSSTTVSPQWNKNSNMERHSAETLSTRLTNASRAYQKGYQAGLHREPIGLEMDQDYIAGYCDGIKISSRSSEDSTAGFETSHTSQASRTNDNSNSNFAELSLSKRCASHKDTGDAFRRLMLPTSAVPKGMESITQAAFNTGGIEPRKGSFHGSERLQVRSASSAMAPSSLKRHNFDITPSAEDRSLSQYYASQTPGAQLAWMNSQASLLNKQSALIQSAPLSYLQLSQLSINLPGTLSATTNNSKASPTHRAFPQNKFSTPDVLGRKQNRSDNSRVSQTDGAMDEQQELVKPVLTTERAIESKEDSPREPTYTCGLPGSPSKYRGGYSSVSPSKGSPTSPKSSPAKQKLEQFANFSANLAHRAKGKGKKKGMVDDSKNDINIAMKDEKRKWEMNWHKRPTKVQDDDEKDCSQPCSSAPVHLV